MLRRLMRRRFAPFIALGVLALAVIGAAVIMGFSLAALLGTATANQTTITPPTGGAIAWTPQGKPTGIYGETDAGNRSQCTIIEEEWSAITMVAQPKTGYTFASWTGACFGTRPGGNFSVNPNNASMCSIMHRTAPTTVSATFAHPLFRKLNSGLNSNGGGTVTGFPNNATCGQECTLDVAFSSVVTLTATPATGAQFDR